MHTFMRYTSISKGRTAIAVTSVVCQRREQGDLLQQTNTEIGSKTAIPEGRGGEEEKKKNAFDSLSALLDWNCSIMMQ